MSLKPAPSSRVCILNYLPDGVLGETNLQEISDFLTQNKFVRQWQESIYSQLTLSEYIQGEQIVLYFRENNYFGDFIITFNFDEESLLEGVRLRFNNPHEWLRSDLENFSLSKVLSHLEEMPEVYIVENRSTFRISDYNLIVYYTEMGVEVWYNFDLTGDNPTDVPIEALTLCLDLDRINSVQMWLYHPENVEPLPDSFKTPENAYGIGIPTEDFVQFFRDHPDECLDIAQYNAEREP
jgi:hypothetical protein